MLKVILYTSDAKLENVEIDILIDKARVKNKRLGITGFLVCHLNGFIQLIEGEEEAIDGLMNEISADDRHSNVRIKESSFAEQRKFPDWEMGLMTISDTEPYYNQSEGESLVEIFCKNVNGTLAEIA
ncbi:BLUF domain-containing protein [Vibrio sonorensis]|uniref:BLUF domain-containing protein n=1 Tax=Vibrio sonorensis TaxID=1004316 RepID=UPI0008D9D34C|nr:BLUF domain-containing protein [Vibrio sonorensis]